MLLLVVITVGAGYVAAPRAAQPTWRLHPASSTRSCTSAWLWYVLLFFVIAGAANGVNLTDGLDGLAAGTGDHRCLHLHSRWR